MPEDCRLVLLELVTKSCIVKTGRSVDDTRREVGGYALELAEVMDRGKALGREREWMIKDYEDKAVNEKSRALSVTI
jgi:hypothetical protein